MRDGAGYHHEELPQLNVKKLVQCWEWVDYKSGLDGEPVWYQGLWHTNFDSSNERVKEINGLRMEENHCGTAFCVAGYAVQDQMVTTTTQTGYTFHSLPPVITNAQGEEISSNAVGYEGAGRHVLGLTYTESTALFAGNNSKEDIREIMNSILASRGEEIRV